MSDSQRFALNSPLVVADIVDGEAIVVHLGTGTYYNLVGDSMLVWNAILGGASPREIAAAAAGVTGEDVESTKETLQRFCESLVGEGLIVERVAEPDGAPSVDLSGATGQPLEPRFDSYSDMQDLVLLDPVHEVDERGWPHAQAPA